MEGKNGEGKKHPIILSLGKSCHVETGKERSGRERMWRIFGQIFATDVIVRRVVF